MTPMESKRAYRRDLILAGLMVVTGLGISAASLLQLGITNMQADRTELAQATPPLQSTPGAESKPAAPDSDATTGLSGARPTATPPQPARPDADAQKAGAKTVLPAAPAEKMAPAIPAR